jgi:hypothetical protein
MNRLTDNPDEALIHICSMLQLNLARDDYLAEMLSRYDRLLTIRPSGWPFNHRDSSGIGSKQESIGLKRQRSHENNGDSSSSSSDEDDELEKSLIFVLLDSCNSKMKLQFGMELK